jgi:hypothetical protein
MDVGTNIYHGYCDNCGKQNVELRGCTMPDGSKVDLCDSCIKSAQAEIDEYNTPPDPNAQDEDEPLIEIEEEWQPTEEDQKKLREGIHWETAFKNILRKDISDDLAHEAVIRFKDLVGEDAFTDELFKYPDLAGDIGAKIFRKTVRSH